MTTTSYAALLRGINVGGHRKVPMAELRAALTGKGFRGVRTHLQSGNVVFAPPEGEEGDAGVLAGCVARVVEDRFGFPVDVVVRDHAYLKGVVDSCPFPAAELEGRQLHATYFSGPVDISVYASLDPAAFLPEEFRLGDRVLYLLAPDGLGRSKLAEALGRCRLPAGTVATSRNWNTVTRLAELTAP
ncbi:hypothetical protein GCM10010218_43020 [Streptomyces mashuensis]|uniref:DUF1697 domain-containing protein n=1 Tax=Streptomyces mashuensis TaxID=33904 RepID=A0A919B5G7_9ACTN|nr:DUF1697 domain-containing protein [Streptomyces mashuensis]GHF57057.1 hypothetical protein GCM10010218_43020 [Streptomyces mashuensis]